MIRPFALRRLGWASAWSLGVFVIVFFAVQGSFHQATTAPLPAKPSVIAKTLPKPARKAAKKLLQNPVVKDRSTLGTFPAALDKAIALPEDMPTPLPTNAWWSGGVLEDWPAPLFAWPLVTSIGADGVTITAPGRLTVPRAIVQQPRAPLRIQSTGKPLHHARIQSWGDWDVTFRLHTGKDEPAYDVTAAQGSPFVQVTPYVESFTVDLPPSSKATKMSCDAPCSAAYSVKSPDVTYVVAVRGGDMTLKGSRLTVKFKTSEALLSVGLVPLRADETAIIGSAFALMQGTKTAFEVLPTTVETTFTFPGNTLMGVFPHQQPYAKGLRANKIGSYETVRGIIDVYEGQSFKTVVPRLTPPPTLPLPPGFKDDQAIIGLLRGEVLENRPLAGDVYWSAKDLLRSAQLAEIADATGNAELKTKAFAAAKAKIAGWCTAPANETTFQFAYDTKVGGLIASPVAFGSEHYNDHHFHAGYFIHSAAILARIDPSIATDYGDCIRLIIRDVASSDRADASFPYLRHFDAYAGHSWANGLTRMGDGNNQESTSEAMHAWYSIMLWGKTTRDTNLENLGTWLYSQETVGTRTYWFNAQPGVNVFPENFPHPLISILWGGKADYATFFDGSAEAVHGIQFFPVGTSLFPLLDQGIVSKLIEPIAKSAGDNIWKSSLLLAAAPRSAQNALPVTKQGATIDPGLSYSYVTHWVKALQALGTLQTQYSSDGCASAVFEKNGKKTAIIYRFNGEGDSCNIVDDSGKTVRVTGLGVGWNSRAL